MKKTFIISEIGVNHEGSMEKAKLMIEQSAEAGANAAKFQTYKAAKIAIKDSPAYWDTTKETTKSQFELFQKHDKFWKKEMEELKLFSDNCNIEFMSTPFDFESALFLNDLVGRFKISSSDITNKPFLEYLSDFNKPIILSTGASNFEEIDNALRWLSKSPKISLLHCVLNYPTKIENARLDRIVELKKRYPAIDIGYSDHTLPSKEMIECVMASILGAEIIEKHFTFDKKLPGNDHYHSMDKTDLIQLRQQLDKVDMLRGTNLSEFGVTEKIARDNARRSIVSAREIKKGEIITKNDIEYLRPAVGISPAEIDMVLGKRASVNIRENTPLQWDMIA